MEDQMYEIVVILDYRKTAALRVQAV